ncbi:MAG: leucyl aminopeptidase [Actinomycetota bacterium]
MPTFNPGAITSTDAEGDLLVVGAVKGNVLRPEAARVDRALDGELGRHLAATKSLGSFASFEGAEGQATVMPCFGRLPAHAVMVVGLGEESSVTAEHVRRAGGLAARCSGGYASVVLDIGQEVAGGVAAAAEGFALGCYTFDRYLSDKPVASATVEVLGASQADLDKVEALTEAAIWARDLINEPPSNRGPAVIADLARARAEQAGLQVEVFSESRLSDEGMDGILTVGKGSASGPRLIVLTYDPGGAEGFVGLVGKGITFDSGGLSLKSGEGMQTMKKDCSGGAAVLGAITALPRLMPKIKVQAAVALAENMPSSRAVKPGDVIRHYGGKTSEVLNTDAEGRLVLADALAWMSEQGPDAIVDAATLTGAVGAALGQKVAGVFSNNGDLCAELRSASERTGERIWELPLVEEYRSLIASPVADVRNIGKGRYAGAITAALFLREFVGGSTPWAHLDIAATAWSEQPEHYLPAGATGFGTRLLIDWILNRAG